MAPKPIDLTNQRFGRLVAIARLDTIGPSKWMCRCDCGTEKVVSLILLRRGTVTSCGCYRREWNATKHRTHGMYGTPEYNAWKSMKQRCEDPGWEVYKRYGARGIVVCERWRQSFASFYEDMGPRPSAVHSLERINNGGNYSPDNCRWATAKQQANNRRKRQQRHCQALKAK